MDSDRAIQTHRKGILHHWSSTSIPNIRDGSSSTIMVGELQRLSGADATWSNDGWAVGRLTTLFTMDADFEFSATNPAATPAAHSYGGAGCINSGVCESPGSEHAGGAHVCFADGSVRFLSESLDTLVQDAMGTISGNESQSNTREIE